MRWLFLLLMFLGADVPCRLEVVGDTSQVGYDAPLALHACGCREVRWRQIEGAPLAAWSADGETLRARTLPVQTYFPSLPDGLIPVSPRTQGRYVVEATAGASRVQVAITSTARATGLTSIATDQTVMLRAAGWHLASQPRGSQAHVQRAGDVETLRADEVGAYKLTRDDGQVLELRALTHERTPMDCGRAECHANEARFTAASPMSHALARAGGRFDRDDSCMLGCHTTGEPGVDDGGFSHLLRTMELVPEGPVDDLPRPLQRLAGVRCTACHGPGAIPTPEGRARILRADVCATCHDAPPRYTQVAAWQQSSMAHADARPETRAGRCASCHTTGGFLDRIGVRKRDDLSRDPDGRSIGLGCATCHAPHGKAGAKLVRDLPGGVCASCHAPLPDDVLPSASAATIVGGKLDLGALHIERAVVHGECTSCHSGHTFRASSSCPDCDSLHAEAAALRASLGCNASHPNDCTPSEALYLVMLVEQDRGAAVHNPAFARALLDQARLSAGSSTALRDAGAHTP